MTKEYIAILKPRIVALLTFVGFAASVVAAEGRIYPGRVLTLLVAVALASSGASALNNYFDRDIDRLMERTRHRALPSGSIPPLRACCIGIVLLLLSFFISYSLNFLTFAYILAGASVYVLVYTRWLKRRSAVNIVIGGTAGSFVVLAGFASVGESTTLLAFLMALLLFFWTPPHFWSFALVYKAGYAQAKVPMLPVVQKRHKVGWIIFIHTLLLVLVSLLLYIWDYFGVLYLIIALAVGLSFLISNLKLLLKSTKARAWATYRLSGFYLLLLFMGMLIDMLLTPGFYW